MVSTLDTFQHAVDGLLFPSEADYPFTVFLWQEKPEAPTLPDLLLLTGHTQDSPVETIELDTFFSPVTQIQDWYGEEERKKAQQFQTLVELTQNTLSNIRVYRVGTIEIDVYIVGQEPQSQDWIVLSTLVVET